MKKTRELVDNILKELYGTTEADINIQLKIISERIDDILANDVERDLSQIFDKGCKEKLDMVIGWYDLYTDYIKEVTDYESYRMSIRRIEVSYNKIMESVDGFFECIKWNGELIKEANEFIDSKIKKEIDYLISLLEWSARSGNFTHSESKNIYLKVDAIKEKTNLLINVVEDSVVSGYRQLVKEYMNTTFENYKEYSNRVIGIIDEMVKNCKIKEEKSKL